MPDAIDLSQYKSKAAASDPAPEGDLPKTQMRTAYLVVQDLHGSWQVTPDLSIADQIDLSNTPTPDDLIAGLSVVLSQINAERAAQMTAVMMQQLAAQQMNAMQNQQIASQLHL
jgi:hypothetical protein